MKRISLLLLLFAVSRFPLQAQTNQNKITIDASAGEYKINKNIYGQFSEDLGRCIYGGIWVGPHSPMS